MRDNGSLAVFPQLAQVIDSRWFIGPFQRFTGDTIWLTSIMAPTNTNAISAFDIRTSYKR